MIKDLKEANSKVEYILENYPATRDSDKLLWLAYLSIFHNLKKEIGDKAFLLLKIIVMDKNTCTMESITRMRRRLQENGRFVGTKRKLKLAEEKLVREMMADKLK